MGLGVGCLAAQRRIGGAGGRECPGRRIDLGDLNLSAGRGDDHRVARKQQIDELTAGAYARLSVLQHDDVAESLKEKIKRRSAHADGRERRDDLVGFLVECPVTKRNAPEVSLTAISPALVSPENTARSSFSVDPGPSERLVSSRSTNLASLSAAVRTVSSRKISSPVLILTTRGAICETSLRMTAARPMRSCAVGWGKRAADAKRQHQCNEKPAMHFVL